MNKIVGLLLGLFAFATCVCAQETYMKSSKTWDIPKSTHVVMTPFVVKSNKAILRWNARAPQQKSSASSTGYSVYISTSSKNAKNFTKNPVLKVEVENPVWTRHSISLSRYQGKKIWIAFVNNSSSKTHLYLDEIYAGVPSSVYLLSNIDTAR